MRQTLLTAIMLACIIWAQQAVAQYNKTYISTINGSQVQSTAIDIVDAGNGEACVLSGAGVAGGLPSIVLRKHDFNGNILFETAHTPHVNFFYAEKMVLTPNGEYIVVGTHYDAANVNNPFAARFDNSGNILWFHVYPSNSTWTSYSGSFARVCIVRAEDDPAESYIITAPGDQFYPTTWNDDIVVNALKIDAGGIPVWNKKYALPAADRNGTYAGFTSIDDLPNTLCYGTDGGMHKYLIAGTTVKNVLSERGFQFSIDGNGNIVDQYTEYFISGYPFGHDALFDPATQQFVLTFTMGNNNLAPPVTVSEIAVLKLNFGTLGIVSYDYYWDNNAVENYGVSIKENAPRDAYIIASWVSNPLSVNQSIINTALLKIDKSGTPFFLKRYNEDTYSWPSAIISLTDPLSGTENYVTAGYAHFNNDTRIYSTDVNGDVCGVIDVQPSHNGYDYGPAPYSYSEAPFPPNFFRENVQIENLQTQITDCANAPNPSQYKSKPAGITANTAVKDVKVYPTILTQNNKVIFETIGNNGTDMLAELYTIDGRKAGSITFSLTAGLNTGIWDIPAQQAGNYFIRISTADKSLNKTVKITKL